MWVKSVGDPFNIRNERGISSLNVPKVFVNNFVYQTPNFRGWSMLARKVLGDWRLSGILLFRDGRPFSVMGGSGNDSSGAHTAQDRANYTGQPINVHQGSEDQWLMQYFNPKAFAANKPGTFGNTPRNLLVGPGMINVNASVGKDWRYRERYRLQFRWDMFNAINHPNFALPNATATAGTSFGKILSTSNAPRLMQGGIKLYW